MPCTYCGDSHSAFDPCQESIEAIKAEDHGRIKAMQWQPIETAPFDKVVLLAVRDEPERERRVFVAQEDANGWQFTTGWTGWSPLTFWVPIGWMPLPPPPSEKGKA